MKRILCFILSVLVITSCKKEPINTIGESKYLSHIKTALKDSTNSPDFESLDWSKAIMTKIDSQQLYFVRIPFSSKSITNDFLIIKTDKDGKIEKGKIINLQGGISQQEQNDVKRVMWNGQIKVSSLNRKFSWNSAISNGYIIALHEVQYLQKENPATANLLAQPASMPEIIIISYARPNPGISISTMMALQDLFYTPMNFGSGDIGGGGGGGGGYSSTNSYYVMADDYEYGGNIISNRYDYKPTINPQYGVTEEPAVEISYDWQSENPAIDIEKYVKSFDKIPDVGSTCFIQIFTDLPVDSDPNKLIDPGTGDVGHTFIQIYKEKGNQVVNQYIGFYPLTHKKPAWTNAPMDAKFVDNGGHEFNAALRMDISPGQLHEVLKEIIKRKDYKYDIDDDNCTDFALNVFNACRNKELKIPLYDIPGGMAPYGTSTPNGLYIKLREMWNSHDPEAKNITLGIKGKAGSSTGP